jgi:hypothetical protein
MRYAQGLLALMAPQRSFKIRVFPTYCFDCDDGEKKRTS